MMVGSLDVTGGSEALEDPRVAGRPCLRDVIGWGRSLEKSSHVAREEIDLVSHVALLHDVGKPATRRHEPGGGVSFHHHEVVGAKMVRKRLRALKYSKQMVEDQRFSSVALNGPAKRRPMTYLNAALKQTLFMVI